MGNWRKSPEDDRPVGIPHRPIALRLAVGDFVQAEPVALLVTSNARWRARVNAV
jgi:hypothetical protein